MLSKATIEKICSLLKIKSTDLEEAIKKETEVDVKISEDLEVLTKDQLTTRDQTKYEDGKKVGKEIGVKEVREAAGLEEGLGKDPKKIAEAIKDAAIKDAKIEPDKKVAQLTEQVAALQKDLTTKDAEIATAKQQSADAVLNAELIQHFPSNKLDILSNTELLTLIKTGYKFEDVDGKKIVKNAAGETIADKATHAPLPLGDAIGTIFKERKWINEGGTPPAGRGGGDNGGGTSITKLSELKSKYEKEGKGINGQDFMTELQQLQKDNKDFVID
jgi:hypothetical protein